MMSFFAPVTISISTSSFALNGYCESLTMAEGIVMYCVLAFVLCSTRVRSFKTIRDLFVRSHCLCSKNHRKPPNQNPPGEAL
jgi:hypothetical protein